MTTAKNWTTISESRYPWEREALDFIRETFPPHEPFRAWSNFEFIADDGSINEVDLLVFTPAGFFLIEIKSHRGRLTGDAGTWTWIDEGRIKSTDNPLSLANLKAKKLKSLLQRQKAFHKKGEVPFLEPLIFCSSPDLQLELQGNARFRVCPRDRTVAGQSPARPGIRAAITNRECPGLESYPRGVHDRPTAKLIGQALEQAGIRPSQRQRKVSDYVLEQLIGEGPGYQDWRASHVQVKESVRAVRLYLVRAGASPEERQTRSRAALREFQLLEMLQHPGILKAYGYTEHDVGAALILEHDPLAIRLDHFLRQGVGKLNADMRLDLIRQLAEIVKYANDKKVVHRALSPQSVLVTVGPDQRPRLKVFNWQVGYRDGSTTSGVSREISATSHVDCLVEDASTAYMAPEALTDDAQGEHLDVFSLGAIAYHIFSDLPPASNGLELSEKLRATRGLQISSVLNGAGEALQYLIQFSTHPDVSQRIEAVSDFLAGLDTVEEELTEPERGYEGDPTRAQMSDVLPGGYTVLRRLGQGGSSVALLVQRDGQEFVLKVANDPANNDRLNDEAEVLKKLRHAHIVEFADSVVMSDRQAFAMRPVFADRERRQIETLGHRLRKDGRLQIDLLQRFGEDLLGVVAYLEEQGIPHRDIKPDNIAVGLLGRGDKLHVVLFDFSLSRTPPENIRAGTTGYLDPMLPLRKPARWDLHAERYAASATLYELATGALPKWGDGISDPSQLGPDVEITIDAEQFDPGLRESLGDFFRKAFRRDITRRFDNAEEMLRAWRQCFEHLDESGPISDHFDEEEFQKHLSRATFDSQIAELGLGTRATNALDRANILCVEDLLTVPMRRLLRLRGVGNKTRREITTAVRLLRDRLGNPHREPTIVVDENDSPSPEIVDVASLSVDLLVDRIRKIGPREGQTVEQALQLLLALEDDTQPWRSQSDIGRALDVSRARVGQILARLQERWAKDQAFTRLRSDLSDMLAGQGGVMSVRELADALLLARGSTLDESRRSRVASAVLRAAVEAERTMPEPRFLVRRDGECLLVAKSADLAAYGRRLGELADDIAAEDPLVAPARVMERLRAVPAPADCSLSDSRLLRLAAAASNSAAVSSRQELYPRGMPPLRAIKLSQGALFGVRTLSVEQVRERVSSRYPEAAPLPERPALDDLLDAAGADLVWNHLSLDVQGAYVGRNRPNNSITSGSQSRQRFQTASGPGEPGQITPEEADAWQFEEKLQRALKEGAFLSLLAAPGDFDRARNELCQRFAVELIDLEGLFIDALRDVASKAKVDWNTVLATDATPNSGDWDKLLLLVNRAMPAIEQRLMQARQTILGIYPGMFIRYGQMGVLTRLSQKVGRRDGIPGLWLLLPNDQDAMLDGQPIPLIGPGQKARIPISWLENRHRGKQKAT